MSPRDLLTLIALAGLWGASFLFIKLAVDEVPPLGVVEARLALGAVTVGVVVVVLGHASLVRLTTQPRVLLVGLVHAALPYLCYAWAEVRVPSGIAGISNASAPLFVALLAHVWPAAAGRERLDVRRVVGVGVGLAGVLALVGIDGLRGDLDVLALLVCFVAPLCYAVGALLARSVYRDMHALAPAVSQNASAALLVLPLALLWGRPAHSVGVHAALALLALGVGGTGIAYMLYFRLLASVGATRTLSVTYLLPVFALGYGALFLGERVRPSAVLALLLILAGVSITNDLVRRPRRRVHTIAA